MHPLLRSFDKISNHFPHKAQGNISLLVIFVLLASALIALLAMNQLTHIMNYGSTVNNFFRAHYLAKGGLEIALTEANLRGAGFEMSIGSGESIVTGNILDRYEGFQPSFSVDLGGNSTLITKSIKDTECTSETSVKLAIGNSLVIPLFYDVGLEQSHSGYLATGGKLVNFKEADVQTIRLDRIRQRSEELTFWVFAFSGEYLEDLVGFFTSAGRITSLSQLWNDQHNKLFLDELFTDTNTHKYLIISNQGDKEASFCITSTIPLPLGESLIRSVAQYGGREVGLEAVLSKPFPDFLQGSVWRDEGE